MATDILTKEMTTLIEEAYRRVFDGKGLSQYGDVNSSGEKVTIITYTNCVADSQEGAAIDIGPTRE